MGSSEPNSHLDTARLGELQLSSDAAAHVATCFQCRSARRLLLNEVSLGAYRVLGRIGRGGMGDVFAAVHRETGRRCALKVLRAGRPGLERRLAREAELQQRVANPHVLPLLEVFAHEAGPVLVLPFVEGPTLAKLLTVHRP